MFPYVLCCRKERISINKRKRRELKEPWRGQYVLYFKKYRHLRHMTQEELAFLIGVAPSYLSFYEQDNLMRKRSPKLNLIRDIGLALKICPNDLVILPCTHCELKNECKKRNDVKDDNEHFFEDNMGYYI